VDNPVVVKLETLSKKLLTNNNEGSIPF
jgi:hypothetical protein